MNKELKEKFYSNFKQSEGCWNWDGVMKNKVNGYANFYIRGKTSLAHRASWIIHFGDIPKGICVCHKCDNRKCVNPGHLFLGSYYTNIQDKVKKGRQARGETNGFSTLREEDVIRIREMKTLGLSNKSLSKTFKTHESTIRQIVAGITWRHVGGPITKPIRSYPSRRKEALSSVEK